MPRRTRGDKPMTNAERQARYRARVAARPVIHYRRAADRRSRTQRWRDAVAELVALQAEYAQWFEALPAPCTTLPPARRCRRLPISISATSSSSSRRADTDGID